MERVGTIKGLINIKGRVHPTRMATIKKQEITSVGGMWGRWNPRTLLVGM